jgi:hypothetical protein
MSEHRTVMMIELKIYQSFKYTLSYTRSRLHPHLHALSNPLAVMVAHEIDGPLKGVSLWSEHRGAHLQMALLNKNIHNSELEFLFYDIQFQDIDKTNKLYTRGRKGNNKLHRQSKGVIIIQELAKSNHSFLVIFQDIRFQAAPELYLEVSRT